MGREVNLKRKESSALVPIVSGPKATQAIGVKALVDTGSPATFTQYQVWKRMVDIGAATIEGTPSKLIKYPGEVLVVSRCAPLHSRYDKLSGYGLKDPTHEIRSKTARHVQRFVPIHIALADTMKYDIVVGRDGLGFFPVRTYRDVNKRETVMTFEGNDVDSVDRVFAESISNAVGFIEPESVAPQVVVMYN